MTTESQSQKKINSRIVELINSGLLIEEDGTNKLCAQVIQEFPEAGLGRRGIKQRIKNLLWNKSVDGALQEVVRRREKPEEVFIPLYPYIPLDMVLKRARYHHGITKVRTRGTREGTIPGIGRGGIDGIPKELKKFKMPSATFDKPFKINVNDQENWSLMFLNGSNIGTLHGGDIVGNVTRRALSDANEREDSAIIATNIIALDLLKTVGPSSLKRSLSFGDNVDPENIKDSERREIIKRIIEEEPMDELIFVTAEERINSILNGWTKISTKPDRKPEYRGPIYVILGNNEDQIIRSIAYWEMAWWKVVKEDELSHKLSMTKTARKQAEKREDYKLAEKLAKEMKKIRFDLQLTKMTNIDTPERQRFYRYAKGLVVQKIEEAIPNSKVIGQDIGYLEIAGKKIEVNIPSHNMVTDTLLANYADKYGPKNLFERLADLVVVCHPWSLQFRMTVREADYNGERGSTKVFVAPVAADESYLRETLNPSSSQGHPFARAVLSEAFRSGVLRLDCVSGLVDADVLPTPSLEAFREYPRKRRKSKNSIYDRGPKYIWSMFGSDPHQGGRAKEFVTSAETGKRLGMTEAGFEMMRKDGLCKNDNMRVHLFASPDDQTQGHHFKARVQPDPAQLSPNKIEEISQELSNAVLKARNKQERSEALKKMSYFHNQQIEKRGSDFPLHQVEQVMERNIESNVDVYRSILRCSERSGLIIRGVGEFINPLFGGFDSRNPGVINIGSGNHFTRTVDEEMVEGPLFARLLRAYLSGYPEWRNRSEELEKAVVAPLYSGKFISWGTVQIPGGHEYGLELRSSPTRMQGWGDTLLGATRNLPTRGNYTKIFNKKLPILSVCGDKHYFGAVITSYAFHHMCGSGTHTDSFGEHGFPPNNTGVSFIGLPADGPDSGPMLIRLLPFDVIKDFVEVNPRPLDWETFLPNPA